MALFSQTRVHVGDVYIPRINSNTSVHVYDAAHLVTAFNKFLFDTKSTKISRNKYLCSVELVDSSLIAFTVYVKQRANRLSLLTLLTKFVLFTRYTPFSIVPYDIDQRSSVDFIADSFVTVGRDVRVPLTTGRFGYFWPVSIFLLLTLKSTFPFEVYPVWLKDIQQRWQS